MMHQEEFLWFQRSTEKWLIEGNRNTRYYHIKVMQRKRRNKIQMIKDEERNWIADLIQVIMIFKNFYQKLFTENTEAEFWKMAKVTYPKLDSSFGKNLSVDVNREKIKHTIFDMSPWKTLGPDGFSKIFYHKSCAYVRDSIRRYISNCGTTTTTLKK